MSTVQMPERPAFNSLDPGFEAEVLPPISRLAIASFLLGFVALLAGITIVVLPLAILIAIGCAAVIWMLSRDKTVGGLRLAQIGLCLSVLGCCWSVQSNYVRDSYLYKEASTKAKLFLDDLSAGRKFAAFELTLPEAERQITGTDLNEHYNRLLAADLPSLSGPPMPGAEPPSQQAMKEAEAKDKLTTFLKSSGATEAMTHGSDAEWTLLNGSKIISQTNATMTIAVVMVDTKKPDKPIEVKFKRIAGVMPAGSKSAIALWEIEEAKVVKE